MIHFDINYGQLGRVAEELHAVDERQISKSLWRALRRTEATLRRLSSSGLRRELELRTASALRKRLKNIKLAKVGGLSAGEGVGLWYGLNAFPVSSLKGRARKTSGGAEFRGKEFPGGFVGRSSVKGRNTIFKRAGKERLPIVEQLVPLEDKARAFIEREIFGQVETVFWNHFRRDLSARVRFGDSWKSYD